ncbi:hypothetical protein ACSBR1_040720 [Camellia fascicularis]
MTHLISLSLGTNQFTGPVLDNLPLCPSLKIISLLQNNFIGQIPESFRNFHGLFRLSLSNLSIFNLSAALDILQHCQNLTILALTFSFLGEQLLSYPSLGFKNLKAFFISNCRLTGVFPQWLGGLTNLQLLDLSGNQLDGTIPPWLGNFEFLFYIDLSNNSFTGEIPRNLTRLKCLISRDVSQEDPSLGFAFPLFLKRIMSASMLQYNQNLEPKFGNLKKLHYLDRKCNNLSGNIHEDLSGMTSIEILDLSHNELSGAISLSLFDTFPNSSFEGNLGLCSGEHSSPRPISNQVPQVVSSSKSM